MKRLLIAVLVCVLIVLVVPVMNLLSGPTISSLAGVTPPDPLTAQAHAIFADKCGHCHAANAELPFYASLPFAGAVVHEDMQRGLSFMDYAQALTMDFSQAPFEVVLAKTQFVVEQSAMPPDKYVMLHWSHSLNDEDRATLSLWIDHMRQEHCADKSLSPEYARLVMRPVPKAEALPPAKVALGKKLFHDVRLSSDNSLSCASCHGLDRGGCDQAAVSTGVGNQLGPINSPTVFNAVFGLSQFWDGRAADLYAQADGPVNNPKEMASNWDEVISKLQQDTVMTQEFTSVYPDGYKKENFLDAISVYEKTLVTPNSAFDKFLMGDQLAMSTEQKEGFGLFTGYGCYSCHVGEALGGQSYEKMGRYGDYFADRGNPTEADAGRMSATQEEGDRGKFKVPTLRNVEITYPYFHDARAQTLDEAVKLMAKYQLGRDLPETEIVQISAFLRALTGEYEGKLL